MKVPCDMRMMKGGMIADIYLDEESGTFQRKWNVWSQVFPLREPARGQIAFNFDREDNHLIGLQLYYAKYCLPDHFIEYSEYFRDDEPSELVIHGDEGLLYFYFNQDRGGNSMTQVIEFASPAWGTAVLDFDRRSLLKGVELIGCKHRFSPRPATSEE